MPESKHLEYILIVLVPLSVIKHSMQCRRKNFSMSLVDVPHKSYFKEAMGILKSYAIGMEMLIFHMYFLQ